MRRGIRAGTDRRVLTYRAVRTDRWLYVRYRSGERELYDLATDPDELRSLHADPRYRATVAVLDRLARQLAACSGDDCRTDAPPIPQP